MYGGTDICENCKYTDFNHHFFMAYCFMWQKTVSRFDHCRRFIPKLE